jgi:hypothetical protein
VDYILLLKLPFWGGSSTAHQHGATYRHAAQEQSAQNTRLRVLVGVLQHESLENPARPLKVCLKSGDFVICAN